ncbi:unnamed protein product [Periconia digitata]|uniref:Uncharacterized protein n=1 Tax=Periconia digitata TaxID=1303443 RepID=A0A9W4U4E0_9PLEO|nr:unnamed protein product [Periconia digitata]
MGNLDDIPEDTARLIVDELRKEHARVLVQLCLVSKKSRDLYQPLLFRSIVIKDSDKMIKLAYALATNTGIRAKVKHAKFKIEFDAHQFDQDESYVVDSRIIEASKSLPFWSYNFQSLLHDRKPCAVLGLVIGWLTDLETVHLEYWLPAHGFRSMFQQRARSTWDVGKYVISTYQMFGAASRTHPHTIPSLKKLRSLWVGGIAPDFAFNHPILENIELNLGDKSLCPTISTMDIFPFEAVSYDTITTTSIYLHATVLNARFSNSLAVCTGGLMQKLTKLKEMTVIVYGYHSTHSYFIDDDLYSFSSLTEALIGNIASLTLRVGFLVQPFHQPRIKNATELPRVRITSNLEVSELILINPKNPQPSWFGRERAEDLFQMRHLTITNANKSVNQILTELIKLKTLKSIPLYRLHIAFLRYTGLIKENHDAHENLRRTGADSEEEVESDYEEMSSANVISESEEEEMDPGTDSDDEDMESEDDETDREGILWELEYDHQFHHDYEELCERLRYHGVTVTEGYDRKISGKEIRFGRRTRA